MDENQFPTIHWEAGGTVSTHVQVHFVFESQRGHRDEVDLLVAALDGDWIVTLPEVKADIDVLGEVALQGDEIKPITADDD